jgi:hypothetical protein
MKNPTIEDLELYFVLYGSMFIISMIGRFFLPKIETILTENIMLAYIIITYGITLAYILKKYKREKHQ